MPIFVGPQSLVERQVEEAVRNALSGDSVITDLGGAIEDAATTIYGSAGAVAGVAEGGAAIEAGEAAGAGILAFFGGWVVLLVIGIVLALLFILIQFRRAIGSIGLGIGAKIEHLLPSPSILNGPIDWAAHEAGHAVGGIMSGFTTAVHWAIQGKTGTPMNTLEAMIYSQVYPVHHEVNELWSWVSHINDWVGSIAHETHGTPPAPTPRSTPLQAQIDQLTHQQHVLSMAQDATNRKTDTNAAAIAALGVSLGALSARLTGVRAVNAGYQDVESNLRSMQNQLDELAKHYGTRIADNTSELTKLKPLEVLTQAGANGIGNLVKIENKLCWCEELPGLPNMLGTALAAIHGLKDGF